MIGSFGLIQIERASERTAIVCDMADDSVLARSSLPGDISPPKKTQTYVPPLRKEKKKRDNSAASTAPTYNIPKWSDQDLRIGADLQRKNLTPVLLRTRLDWTTRSGSHFLKTKIKVLSIKLCVFCNYAKKKMIVKEKKKKGNDYARKMNMLCAARMTIRLWHGVVVPRACCFI